MKWFNDLKGGRLLIAKALLTLLIVFLIEQVLGLLHHTDPTAESFRVFHNHYFLFSDHYLTIPALGSEFSSSPSATFRFAVYTVFGYLLYALFALIIMLTPFLKKYSDKILTWLFRFFLLATFLLAFVFPKQKSIIGDSEICITTYHYGFIPNTEHIFFNAISNADYSNTPYHEGYTQSDLHYLSVRLHTSDNKTIILGEIETENTAVLNQDLKTKVELVVFFINQKIHSVH